MVCTSLGSLLRPLFYFLCYIHFSLSVEGNLGIPKIVILSKCHIIRCQNPEHFVLMEEIILLL